MTDRTGLRVCFDVLGAQELAWDRGIPRYIAEHARALARIGTGLDLCFRADPDRPLMPPAQSLVGTGLLRRTRREPWGDVPDGVPRVLHVSSPFELSMAAGEVWPSWGRGARWTTVATAWDLVPMLFPELYLAGDRALRREYLQRVQMLTAVDHLVAISQCTAEDAHRHLGIAERRITVIDAGVDHDRFRRDPDGAPATLVRAAVPHVRDRYLFFVGGDDPRKNMPGLIRAFARSRARRAGVQLVITCSLEPERRDELLRLAVEGGAERDDVILTGHVSDATLIALYQACELFVFPSLYEGSGLPMLEAMAAGAPVIAADASTGPEIVRAPDALFDPRDERDIARAIDEAISTPGRLDELRARSAERVADYTWDHVATQTIRAYHRAVSQSERRARPRVAGRQQFAIVTPLPPEQTGIADYVARLLPALRRRTDAGIDLVVADHAPVPSDVEEPVVTESAFRARVLLGHRYDAVLFQLGNSGFHSHMPGLLRWTAGQGLPVTAMLHEANLSGIHADAARDLRISTRELARRVHAAYPFLASKPPREIIDFVVREGPAHGVFLTREIQDHSARLLVHSEYARAMLMADRGDAPGPPIFTLPHAAPVPPRADALRDPSLVVSTGAVAAIKGVGTLIEAFALARASRPGLRLVLAGPFGRAEEIERFERRIAALDLQDAVEMTGYLPTADRWRLLGEAGVVVQLRQGTHGEASGAVMDALAAGAPTVVSDVGWMSELPRDAVAHVPAAPAPADLAAVLVELTGNDPVRARLAAAARRYVAAVDLDTVAEELLGLWTGERARRNT